MVSPEVMPTGFRLSADEFRLFAAVIDVARFSHGRFDVFAQGDDQRRIGDLIGAAGGDADRSGTQKVKLSPSTGPCITWFKLTCTRLR